MKATDVLVFTPDFLPDLYGGIGTYVSQLYSYYPNETTKICFIPYGRHAAFPNMDNLLCLDVHSRIENYSDDPYVYWVRYNEEVFKYFQEYFSHQMEVPRIIHIHGSYFALLASALKKKYNSKITYIKHGVELDYTDPDFLKDTVMLSVADQIICPSHWIAKKIKEIHLFPFSDPKVIHSGIDKGIGIPTHKEKMILFCGRLSSKKGCNVLIDAVSRIAWALKEQKYTVVIAGTGDEEGTLKYMVREKSLEAFVQFVGYVEHKEALEYMSKSRILVIPSLREPFGLVAIEGFSCGACVVCSNSGGLTEIVTSGKNGLLFETGDGKDLAEKILYLVNNPGICESLSKNGKESLSCFSWERVYEDYLKIDNQLLADWEQQKL